MHTVVHGSALLMNIMDLPCLLWMHGRQELPLLDSTPVKVMSTSEWCHVEETLPKVMWCVWGTGIFTGRALWWMITKWMVLYILDDFDRPVGHGMESHKLGLFLNSGYVGQLKVFFKKKLPSNLNDRLKAQHPFLMLFLWLYKILSAKLFALQSNNFIDLTIE